MEEAPNVTDMMLTAPVPAQLPSLTCYEDISVDQLVSSGSHGAVGPIQPQAAGVSVVAVASSTEVPSATGLLICFVICTFAIDDFVAVDLQALRARR